MKCSKPKPGPPVVSICTVRSIPRASGVAAGHETRCGAGGAAAGAGADAGRRRSAGPAVGVAAVVGGEVAGPAAAVCPGERCRWEVLSVAAGVEVTAAAAVNTGAMLATVRHRDQPVGTGLTLGSRDGLRCRCVRCDRARWKSKHSFLVSATAARTEKPPTDCAGNDEAHLKTSRSFTRHYRKTRGNTSPPTTWIVAKIGRECCISAAHVNTRCMILPGRLCWTGVLPIGFILLQSLPAA